MASKAESLPSGKKDAPWYIAPAEAAERTGLAQTTIHYALHAGTLRGYRVGRRWLIDVNDLHAWIRGDGDHSREVADVA